ncbi:Hypothetical predicted protein [Pelobates cultripes]|uniref:Uncharacterized protein n=1 Tax=Pelobates cultripes TaxID=61616 RepID=A0AAD1VYS6_PELCU|nr:Hypothetical predicted protein [Pelobates cultripes]
MPDTTEDLEKEKVPWQYKSLHGVYHWQIVDVAHKIKSYQLLEKAELKDRTEALILTAQEQALCKRSIEVGVFHTRQDPRCKEAPATIQHLGAVCKMLAGTAYTEKHNQVTGIVYQIICTDYGLDLPNSIWEIPQRVVEIHTDKQELNNQPDIVVVDVAIPSDYNFRKKEHKKMDKYQGLKEEQERMWKVKAV